MSARPDLPEKVVEANVNSLAAIMEADSVLRHIVTFRFKASTPAAEVTEISRRFGLLQDSIPGIIAYEHGINNSPEGLSKGLNHIYQVTFESAAARDAYLPHAAHQRFVGLLGEVVEDVMVVDYWGH